LDPAVKRKIFLLQIFGVPCVVGFFSLAFASFRGFLPTWVFTVGLSGEILFGFYFLRKIHSLRNSKGN
jgi:hypothetical protein